MSKTKAIKYCAGTISTPVGYLGVVFDEAEGPTGLLERAAKGEQVPGIGGPFPTEDEAKAFGSRVLTEMGEALAKKGIKSHRFRGVGDPS